MARQRKQRADHRAHLRGKPFIGLPAAVLYSPAYQDLSLWARAVLLELLGRFNGYNNGKIAVSFRELAGRLGTSSLKSIGPALIELHEHGFLDITAEGKWKPRQARLYRLTFLSSGIHGQRAASNEYASWLPSKEKSRLPHTVTGKPIPVPLTVTERTKPVPQTVTGSPISSVWGKAEPVTARGTLIGKPSLVAVLGDDFTPSNPAGDLGCEDCGEPFGPGDRGKPKQFCSETCRKRAERQRAHQRRKAAA